MIDPLKKIAPQIKEGSPEYLARFKELEIQLAHFKQTIILSIEIVTPSWCIDFLGENRDNRRIRWDKVDQIASDIIAGDYKFNGQPFIKGESHLALDAQHRALAVILAGLPIISVVVSNIPDDARDTIDSGTARSAADELQLSGVSHSVPLASAAKSCLLVLSRQKNFKRKFSTSQVRKFALAHPELHFFVEKSHRFYRPYPTISYISALSFLFNQKDPQLNDMFWNKLKTGLIGTSEGNPIHALRRYCEALAYAKKKDWNGPLLCFTILAWNALREGHKIKKFTIDIYARLDAIPEII